jgi:tetraacyldisaccharide 4'-kinase
VTSAGAAPHGRLEAWFQFQWYGRADANPWLVPLERLFAAAASLRRTAYRRGLLVSRRFPVPVIIVGNLTVGGAGKTPLVLWLAERLAAAGWRPGIVSRGYRGRPASEPTEVLAESDPADVGDEPLLLALRSKVPVYVHRDRGLAVSALLARHPCDLVIADDGLQHYALGRDLEIAVVDGARRFGNGHLLPAGPLREPPGRLKSADLVVCNGGAANAGEWPMTLVAADAVNLISGERRPLAAFAGDRALAVAGIGNPGRFFELLAGAGLSAEPRPFPDHHRYVPGDLPPAGCVVLMTEKDAVKCRGLAAPDHWYVPVAAQLPPEFGQRLCELLEARCDGQEIA